jgi:aminoglycoside phosphotransferase (APT) family kinase protein
MGTVPPSVTRLGAGLDNVAYDVDGRWVVRFAGDPDAVAREARVLDAVAPLVPVPVPRPVLALPGRLVHRRLSGVPLLSLPRPHRAAFAPALVAFLEKLHGAAGLAAVLPRDDAPPAAWLAELPAVAGDVPAGLRGALEAFLAGPAPRPGDELTPVHNDLGAEHVLVDGDAITGVIDWTDAAIGDPAADFGRLLRDLGPGAVVVPEPLRERAGFYARSAALDALRYAHENGRVE